MANFDQEITNFKQYGVYQYKFDNVGNMIFDSSSADFSQVYLAFPLQNVIYNKSKIQKFYDPTFTEFVPTTPVTSSIADVTADELQLQLITTQEENIQLKQELDKAITQNESNGAVADKLASKEVILELRKSLGQGRIESDFSEDFPYTPIKKNKI